MYYPLKDYRAKDSLPSGDPAKIIRGSDIQAELEAISKATTSLKIAACKSNGQIIDVNEGLINISYEYNVASIHCPVPDGRPKDNYGSVRVTFKNLPADFDLDYIALIQPYATNARHCIATVTDQRSNYIEWTQLEWDGTQWVSPLKPIGFSFVMMDITRE